MQYPRFQTLPVRATLAAITLAVLSACGGGGGGTGGAPAGATTTSMSAGGSPSASALQGGDFAVNSETAGDQYGAQAVRLPDGSFAIAWSSRSADGSSSEVRVQRFDARGQPLGTERAVGAGSNAQVTAFADGRFLVTWRISPYLYTVLSRGQMFDAQGQPAGGVLELGTGFNNFSGQAVALPGGGFLFVAEANQGRYAETFTVLRRFAADGAALATSELHSTLMPTTSAYDQNTAGRARAAVLADGRIAVAWTAFGPAANELRLSLFDAAGAALGGHTVLASGTGVENPSITALGSGGFAVAWEGGVPPEVRTARLAVFDAAGNAVGQHTLATEAGAFYATPLLATLSDGSIAASWRVVRYGPSSTQRQLWAQRFDTAGAPSAAPQRLPDMDNPLSATGGVHGIAAAANGQFLVVHDRWTAEGGTDVRGTFR